MGVGWDGERFSKMHRWWLKWHLSCTKWLLCLGSCLGWNLTASNRKIIQYLDEMYFSLPCQLLEAKNPRQLWCSIMLGTWALSILFNCHMWISFTKSPHCLRWLQELPPLHPNFIQDKGWKDKVQTRDFPGGTVLKIPPANAGDIGLSPGPGRSHVPQSN